VKRRLKLAEPKVWTLAEVLAPQGPEGVAPSPLVVSYGAGVDSTAMLVGMQRRGLRPGLILFADPGSEHPETYAYLDEVVQPWLASVGFPPVVTVKKAVTHGKFADYATLEEKCLANGVGPSITYGFQRHECSLTWKHGPMDKYVEHWAPAVACWERGVPVTRCIGYGAGPEDSRRCWDLGVDGRGLYRYLYLLREWGWDRPRCAEEIRAAGLPVPMKSSCVFCAAQKPEELRAADERHPDIGDRIMVMEATMAPYNTVAEGLWFKAQKGRTSGSMTEHILRWRAERGALVPTIESAPCKRPLPGGTT
jgi:hypothetical protein